MEADPDWTLMGYARYRYRYRYRYRSRRDMIELATNPDFLAGHPFKLAAIERTFNFPTSPTLLGYLGPRIWVGLLLALMAALGHLARLLL